MALLTVAEVAEQLRVSPDTVRRLVQQNKLPAIRLLPGKLLFSAEAIQELLRGAMTVPAGAQTV